MAPYEFVAAAWSRAAEKVSLKDWLQGEYILVLGNDEETRSALDAINRVLFKRLSELILAQSESTTRRTWIFLDEVREAGELEGLGRLMTMGRSNGACVVLGFQDIEGMRDAYGKEGANEIIGMCANKAILRLSSPETAEWAAKVFGEYEAIEIKTDGGRSRRGAARTAATAPGAAVAGPRATGRAHGTGLSPELLRGAVRLGEAQPVLHPQHLGGPQRGRG